MRAYRLIGLMGFLCVVLCIAGCGIRDYVSPRASISPCRSLEIKPASQDFANSGGVGEFIVTASRACSWNPVVENQSRDWLQIEETTDKTVKFTVTPNTSGIERTGRIFVGPRSFLVRQGTSAPPEKEVKKPIAPPKADDPCQGMVIEPRSKNFDDRGGIDRIDVQAPEGCQWKNSVKSEVEWIDVRLGANSVSYRVKPNTGDEARASVIHIGPVDFSVRQRGAGGTAESPCKDLEISPASKEFDHEGGNGSFEVMAPEDCYWQAQVDARSAEWIEMRTLDNSVKFRVEPNNDLVERQGTIIVGAKVFHITQSGRAEEVTPPCSNISLTPTRLQFDAGGGTNSVQVRSEGNCEWKAVVENYSREWLEARTNGDQVEVSVQPNTGYPRRGRINIGPESLLVEQGGKSL